MNRLACASPALLLLFAGCGGQPTPPAAAPPAAAPPAAAPPASAAAAQSVTLDAAAQKEARLEFSSVERRSVPQVIRATGRLTMNENTTWRIGAITEGRIIKVAARVGDSVQPGQVLARMHSHDIHESRAAYRRAEAERARLTANLEFARRSRDRIKRLYDLKAASFEQLDHAENELKNALLVLDSAQIEVNRARIHLVDFLDVPIEGPEHTASGEPHAYEDLIPVKAPAAGIIVSRNITPGAVVGASSDLFVIADLSTIWAIAAVQEEHLARLRVGMPASLSVQAYPAVRFPGRLAKIDERLDAATRTVSARIELANREGRLRPEMYASIELDAGGSEPALLIPQSAVQDLNGQPVVFRRAAPDRFDAVAVELGVSRDGLVQALRGLRAGDVVVSHGSFILKSQLLKSTLTEE